MSFLKFLFLLYLTIMYAQCVQTKDTSIVPKIPPNNPALAKARGIDNIPVPKDAFDRWISVSQSL